MPVKDFPFRAKIKWGLIWGTVSAGQGGSSMGGGAGYLSWQPHFHALEILEVFLEDKSLRSLEVASLFYTSLPFPTLRPPRADGG